MTDSPDRAERALRDAFAAAATHRDPGFAPLDPDALRSGASASPAPGWPRRWLPLAAAAAVLVLAVPIGAQLLGRGRPAVETAGVPGAVPAAAPADRSEQASAEGASPLPGFRYASMVDVVVQVPASWGYARALGPDWCVEGTQRLPSDPAGPFVDVRPEGRAVRAIRCPGDVPAARQAMHLTWRHADGTPGEPAQATDGWVRVSRPVGSAILTVVAPTDQRALAEQVLGTARQVAVDHLGCPMAAPVGPGREAARPTAGPLLADQPGGQVVLCQYDDLTLPAANLVGSKVLDFAASGAVLDVLHPSVAVPTRGACVQDDREATLVVVGILGTDRASWVRVPGCDPSIVDDGTRVGAASASLCAAVFTPPLALPDGGQADDACLAARPGWSASSTTVVSQPRWTRFSATSRPMKPAPMTTAVRFGDSSPSISPMRASMRSTSSMLRRASARSAPGIPGTKGAAPGLSTSAS